METLDLFAEEDNTAKIEHILSTLSAELRLAPNRLILAPHSGKDKASDILLEEMPYPPTPGEEPKARRTLPLCSFKRDKAGQLVLAVKPALFAQLPAPEGGILGARTPAWQMISFANDADLPEDYIKSLITLAVATYDSAASFGSCSRFAQCEAKGHCLHENILYAKGCFFGKRFNTLKD